MDYDDVFGRLAVDCNLSYDRIRDLTPRQTFDHYFRPRDKETGEPEPLPQYGDEPLEDRSMWAPGMPKGLGLERHECWRRQPGENPDDPFSLSREVVKARHYSFLLEYCQRDLLRNIPIDSIEGRRIWKVRKGDMKALRDMQDETWRLSVKRFEQVKKDHEGKMLRDKANEEFEQIKRDHEAAKESTNGVS